MHKSLHRKDLGLGGEEMNYGYKVKFFYLKHINLNLFGVKQNIGRLVPWNPFMAVAKNEGERQRDRER